MDNSITSSKEVFVWVQLDSYHSSYKGGVQKPSWTLRKWIPTPENRPPSARAIDLNLNMSQLDTSISVSMNIIILNCLLLRQFYIETHPISNLQCYNCVLHVYYKYKYHSSIDPNVNWIHEPYSFWMLQIALTLDDSRCWIEDLYWYYTPRNAKVRPLHPVSENQLWT